NFYKHIDYQFDRLEFADRSLTRDELRKEGIELFGTDGDDKFIDWGGKVTIDAGAGDDTIRTGDSDDTLIGGSGNDDLSGGYGDDTLIGGTGNDKLDGGFGADTYIFSKGHGQDIVYEDSDSDHRKHDIDTLIFKDVNYSEVKFRQMGNDLVLYGYHDNDSVTIKNFYKHIDYQFDRLEFADR
ncbi:calcium-binding protein, partial [Pasteurellaceae bacterium LIM206]|nr:calcium-binding protein [Pasteurellaceae bacterium LIM206]